MPRPDTAPATRTPLTRARVLAAAVEVADEGGIEAVTMRRLAERVGVEAMSLYHHVANKEAILDGVVEVVVDEINRSVALLAPSEHRDWQMTLRARILAAREVLLRHPWAPDVIEQRSSMSPSVVLYFEGVLGILREGGCSWDLSHHALHALGSRAIGFSQELFSPADAESDTSEDLLAAMAESLPNLVGMLSSITHDPDDPSLGWCDDQTEFEFGLDVLLAGIEARRVAEGSTP